jgi:hypothetical protein
MTTADDNCTRAPTPKIRIPKWAWNSFKPQDQEKPVPPSPYHRGCKTKLWRFHHGGPKRGVKGAMQNEITYETPCLQSGCANCWKWHPNLMRDQYSPGELPNEDVSRIDEVDIEPISPEIDPRILNGTWQDYMSQRSSTESMGSFELTETIGTPVLTPVKSSFDYDSVNPDVYLPLQHDIDDIPTDQEYHIFLPTSIVSGTISGAPTKTRWRCTPRQRHTVRLCFPSHAGKRKFRLLVLRRDKKAKKAVYDREYRARLKITRERITGNCS